MSEQHDEHASEMRLEDHRTQINDYDTAAVQHAVSGIGRSTVRSGIPRMDGIIRKAWREDENPGTVSGGRECASGPGRADGNAFGNAGSGADHQGPRFDLTIPPQGYGWWYADAISDDRQYGFSIIAMLGSVFSPYYAWSGRHHPLNHVGLNVGLYGPRVKRWTLTERGENELDRTRHTLAIGPSSLSWNGSCLEINIDEIACPVPRRVKGKIRLYPEKFVTAHFQLDARGNHHWQPLSPRTRVEVEFSHPEISWSGNAYIDSNWGSEPLEKGFENWSWSRAHSRNGTQILYDAFTRDGENTRLALEIARDGTLSTIASPKRYDLGNSPVWKVARPTLCRKNDLPETLAMLEDTPFYTRSHVKMQIDNEAVMAVHESLDCNRFASRWVRMLLPFRMPRRASRKN